MLEKLNISSAVVLCLKFGYKASKYFLTLALFISIIPTDSFAQEDECPETYDRKTLKLLDKAREIKKHDYGERKKFLLEALDISYDCVECAYELAFQSYRHAKQNHTGYKTAKEYYHTTIELCPSYHADMYYILGVIYTLEEDYPNALKYFEFYLNFPYEGDGKFSKKHDKQIKDTEDALPRVRFFAEFYGNPVDFNPQRLKNVSSDADEYLPALSPDNEIIFYTRQFERKNIGDMFPVTVEELTFSKRLDIYSDFDAGTPMPGPFNMGNDNYGGATMSVNNKEMYITICRPIGGYNNCDIYVSRYTTRYDDILEETIYRWTEPENLGENVNTPDGWESQPTLSADGKTLYFATIRHDTDGMDIYYSNRDKDGSWTKAQGIGPPINTKGNEKAPFMHADSKTMYFASSGRPGAGGYDIFYSRMSEDGTWSEPKNIGYPINTSGDEHGLIVSTDGKYAYFASNKIKGAKGLDIFYFEMPEAAKPEKVVLVKGELKEENGNPLTDAKLKFSYSNSEESIEIDIDNTDGSYAAVVNVIEDEDIVMTVKKEGMAFDATVFKTSEEDFEPIAKTDKTIARVEKGRSYTIENINFNTNSAEIKQESKIVLNAFIEYLKDNESLKIAIHGHTDNVGNAEENRVLSFERAFAVRQYLEEKGVSAKRLQHDGFGSSKPIASNDTPLGRSQNRRTEFKVMD
jgi:outer membrane protein OmpA-like peptidoglycan-associated protein